MTPDRSAVERVKRNLFGSPTESEKKQFNQQYEDTFKEERKVISISGRTGSAPRRQLTYSYLDNAEKV